MRDAAAWLSSLMISLAALAGASASGQDLAPEEEVMEQLGSPPTTPMHPEDGTPVPDDSQLASRGAEPDPDLLANVKLLDALLIRATAETVREQKFAAAGGITGGVILLGMGAWRITEKNPQSNYSRGLGVMFMTLGAADLTTGIFAATRVSHEKRRLARWEQLKADGIGENELGRMEGELLSSAETREGERLLVRWNGLTHTIAGGIIMGLAPVADQSTRDRRTGFIVGGLFMATGLAAFILSYRDTPSEKAWKEYQAKKQVGPMRKFNVRIAPSMWKGGGGVSAGGTF
ncbi:MAG: hypothetical protein WBG86_08045 [Polyangiales bacterium]